MQKLQCVKQEPSTQQRSSVLQDEKTTAKSQLGLLKLEESMDTFLAAAQAFDQVFHQVRPHFLRLSVSAALKTSALHLMQVHLSLLKWA